MIPETVTFSDLGSIDPARLLKSRIFMGYPPFDWMRVGVQRDEFVDQTTVDRWCGKNLQGRWARCTPFYMSHGWNYIIWFEHTIDAVFFKMSGDDPFE